MEKEIKQQRNVYIRTLHSTISTSDSGVSLIKVKKRFLHRSTMVCIRTVKYCLTLLFIVKVVSQTISTEEKTHRDSVVFHRFSEMYTTKSKWLLTSFNDVTLYENFMNDISEDIRFLRGDLQRVHTRYVEVIDPNIPDIIKSATRVKISYEY